MGVLILTRYADVQGPVVQSIVSLTSSLVVKILTVLASTISNSQVFLLKNVRSFCKCKSYSHFFSKNISISAICNDQHFNDTLTNNIVSFEQLGHLKFYPLKTCYRLCDCCCFTDENVSSGTVLGVGGGICVV